MSNIERAGQEAIIVESELSFTLVELSRACGVEIALVETLVHEGVFSPQGGNPAEWRFEGSVLPRARTATRLLRDLELNPAAAALVLDLLGQIDALKSEILRLTTTGSGEHS